MVKDEMTDESALPESEQARRMIRRSVLRMVGSGQLHSREDVIRYLINEGGFDILSVTDTSVTLCAPDEPEEMLTLTGVIRRSVRSTLVAPPIVPIQRTCLSCGMTLPLLNAICSTGHPAGQRERTGNRRTDTALNYPRT